MTVNLLEFSFACCMQALSFLDVYVVRGGSRAVLWGAMVPFYCLFLIGNATWRGFGSIVPL